VDNIERRFAVLEFLLEDEGALDQFNTEYETLLRDVKESKGARYKMAERLKVIQMRQAVFVLTLREIARIKEGIKDDNDNDEVSGLAATPVGAG
jgi:hypothetical protein